MNKARRKQISDLVSKLEEVQSELETITQEEEYYKDNIPENLQGSEKYEVSESACSELEDACSSLSDIIDNLNNIS